MITPATGWRLNLATVDTQTAAWSALNVDELGSRRVRRRVDSLVIPFAAGRRPFPQYDDEWSFDLLLWFVGDIDSAGLPIVGGMGEGLQINLAEFEVGVMDAVTDANGTVLGTLTQPDGADLTARVRCDSFTHAPVSVGMVECPATLAITVTSGLFA